jgi:hypothetical protein
MEERSPSAKTGLGKLLEGILEVFKANAACLVITKCFRVWF